jgi:formylmethanofuran dehydrogenase subunit D
MKILKEKSREYNGQPYFKYKINIPEQTLKDSGFKEGDELSAKAKKGKVVLKRK